MAKHIKKKIRLGKTYDENATKSMLGGINWTSCTYFNLGLLTWPFNFKKTIAVGEIIGFVKSEVYELIQQ